MTYEYNSTLKPYIVDFLANRKPHMSKSCYDHWAGILQHFDEFVLKQGYEDPNFTEFQMLQWIKSIDRKAKTSNYYVCAIRAFFGFLEGYGHHPFIPPYSKEEEYMAYDYSDEELERLLAFADNYVLSRNPKSPEKLHPQIKYTYVESEFPMILRILTGCGLRVGEAVMLQLKDIDFATGTLTIRKTKSKEYRIVPMDPSLTRILALYCEALVPMENSDAFVFPGTDFSNPIPERIFRGCFNRARKALGIELPGRKKYERGPCVHCLRHAFAHRSFKKGAREGWAVNDQIPWLSIYLGHKNLKETEKYLKFSSEMFSDEINPFEVFSMDLFPEVSYNE